MKMHIGGIYINTLALAILLGGKRTLRGLSRGKYNMNAQITSKGNHISKESDQVRDVWIQLAKVRRIDGYL